MALKTIPSWDQLYRMAPLALTTTALSVFWYWMGRKSQEPFIDYLRERGGGQ